MQPNKTAKRAKVGRPRLLQITDLPAKGITYSRPHIWRLIRDGLFPAPFKIVDRPNAKNVWSEDTIDTFIEERQAAVRTRRAVA